MKLYGSVVVALVVAGCSNVGAKNAEACQAWLDDFECGTTDLSQYLDCAVFEETPCDVSSYFACLTDNTTCSDGVADTTGWTDCISYAGCDGGTYTSSDDPSDDDDDDSDPSDDDDSDTDTVGDTDTEGPRLRWAVGAWAGGWPDFVSCGANKVTFAAETKRLGGSVQLYLTQTDNYGDFIAWEEEHTLDEVSASETDGPDAFTVYERELVLGDIENQKADESTLWGCDGPGSLDPADPSFEVAFALAVWAPGDSPASDSPADCIYFGHRPAELYEDRYTGGTGDGAERSQPDWISSCRLVE